jgi:hypothetical protein
MTIYMSPFHTVYALSIWSFFQVFFYFVICSTDCQDPYFHTLTNGRQRNVFSDTALQFGFGSRTKASS